MVFKPDPRVFVWNCQPREFLYYSRLCHLHIDLYAFICPLFMHHRYPTLLDRFLCLRHVYNKPQTLKKANFKFMNRELLWHGYAEFLFFIIPLINVDKLKSILRRIIGLRSPPSQIQGSLVASGNLSRSCPVCSRSPTQPYISECGHLFCYICIKSNFLSNPSFACPLCNIAIGQNITPYRPQ